jgi:hypothetical protein
MPHRIVKRLRRTFGKRVVINDSFGSLQDPLLKVTTVYASLDGDPKKEFVVNRFWRHESKPVHRASAENTPEGREILRVLKEKCHRNREPDIISTTRDGQMQYIWGRNDPHLLEIVSIVEKEENRPVFSKRYGPRK